eukprot:Awhi_evm1s13106
MTENPKILSESYEEALASFEHRFLSEFNHVLSPDKTRELKNNLLGLNAKPPSVCLLGDSGTGKTSLVNLCITPTLVSFEAYNDWKKLPVFRYLEAENDPELKEYFLRAEKVDFEEGKGWLFNVAEIIPSVSDQSFREGFYKAKEIFQALGNKNKPDDESTASCIRRKALSAFLPSGNVLGSTTSSAFYLRHGRCFHVVQQFCSEKDVFDYVSKLVSDLRDLKPRKKSKSIRRVIEAFHLNSGDLKECTNTGASIDLSSESENDEELPVTSCVRGNLCITCQNKITEKIKTALGDSFELLGTISAARVDENLDLYEGS